MKIISCAIGAILMAFAMLTTTLPAAAQQEAEKAGASIQIGGTKKAVERLNNDLVGPDYDHTTGKLGGALGQLFRQMQPVVLSFPASEALRVGAPCNFNDPKNGYCDYRFLDKQCQNAGAPKVLNRRRPENPTSHYMLAFGQYVICGWSQE